ncbi:MULTISPECIES: TIM barrel protein [unclassified Sinorhizobium]|uniref:hydroxypyruvate isomerase family protein n=1 Tax=unclassified Sinorhizobium TaxID=2613772 RepID=UPI0024C35E0C|nr:MULTISPECIES: TIM barrel protein [unclassified Sinorhizobium]MDK1378581.1 TIM barrel protein [Sinorhizobium sp. 6-70]MDK1480522.1 TIM barrel protein [Sinorhizobium sp. 6-117]
MPENRWSAHIGYLFTELPLFERIAAAAKAGFTAIEHPQPFVIPAAQMRAELARCGLVFSQVGAAVGDASRGEKGLTAIPGREADFREQFDRALDYANAVDCPFVHPMAGVPSTSNVAAIAETYRNNLSYAVERTAGTPVKVLIEAISEAAVPGYAMSTLDHAARIQDAFGPDNIALLVDTYHACANGTELESWIAANHYRIGHVHIADHPGRHEPATGVIDFESLLEALRSHGFEGAIGFEFFPSKTTIDSAAFLPRWKQFMAASAKCERQDRRPA